VAYRGYWGRPADGSSQHRDFQIAGDATRALGGGTALGSTTLSVALLYDYLFAAGTAVFGDQLFNVEPGAIVVSQLKVTMPVRNSGIKVPISISVANRSELVTERDVRAHIGFTFNYDVIASLFHK
jgi:hypothetical protein